MLPKTERRSSDAGGGSFGPAEADGKVGEEEQRRWRYTIQYNKKKEVESDLWLPQYNEVYPVNEYFWKNEKRRIMHDWHADTQLMPRRVCEGVTDCSVSCHLLR